MEKKILKLEKKPLSNTDIEHLTGGKYKVLSYTELMTYRTLDELLNPNGAFCVLYETDENFGHWVAVIKINDKLVEFFDPLSSKPDGEFAFISNTYKKQPYLKHLLKESPYKLSYNQYKFQKNKLGVNTCGRHCALRMLLKHLSLEQYKKLLTTKKYDYDFMVTLLTEMLF